MKSRLFLALLLLSSFVSLPVSNAAVAPEVELQAQRLMESDNAQAAFELLYAQRKSGPQDWFLYAMAAHRSGHLLEAANAYRKVLRLDPSSSRAKLELATVLAESQQWEESRRLFLDVRSENPPERVRQNIDRYLALVEEQQGSASQWRIRASAGLLYDSNVNNAPSVDTVVMFGLPFTLSDDAKAQAGLAYTFNYEADQLVRLSDAMAWQTGFALQWTDYIGLNGYDNIHFAASTGPVFQPVKGTFLSVPVSFEATAYTQSGDVSSSAVSISPQLRTQLGSSLALTLDTAVTWRHYSGSAERDAFSYSVAPGLVFSACGKGALSLGGRFGREDADIETYGWDNWGLSASISCPLGSDYAMSAYASYDENDYHAREAAFSDTRHDRKTAVGINLVKANRETRWDTMMGASYVSNQSNLALYGYDKYQLMLSARKRW
ncbi:MAG: surface lipoprotein assembly modifier [Nitratireductor sp.]